MKNTKLMLGLLVSSMALQPVFMVGMRSVGTNEFKQKNDSTNIENVLENSNVEEFVVETKESLSSLSKTDLKLLRSQTKHNLFDVINKQKHSLVGQLCLDDELSVENQVEKLNKFHKGKEENFLSGRDTSYSLFKAFTLTTLLLGGLGYLLPKNENLNDLPKFLGVLSVILGISALFGDERVADLTKEHTTLTKAFDAYKAAADAKTRLNY